ncbi:MAG TPA: strawberry notch family protein, partial [Deltaproteobacteria bacterium]|nr:strawberry notch family protein [Deltaproteobacteria bacterium]
MADARYLGSMNPDELRKLGKQRAIEELAKRSTNRSEKPSGEDPSKGQYLGSMPPDELILRMELMRDKAKKDYLRENYESRNVLEDTAAALTAGTLQLAEMSARAARLGREPEDTPNLTKFIEGIDKFREDKQFLKPSREALTREGRRWLYEGVSSAIPSVGLGLPGAAVGSFGGPIGTVGGFAGSAGTVFGMAEFDEFWENARKGAKEGKIDPAMMSEINKKALMSAFAEGGMEAVSNAIDMLAFKVGKVVTAPLKESVRGMLTKGVKGVAKDMAKGYAVALPNEVATEMMQNYLTTKMRKDLGINEVEPIEAAKQSAGPAAVMTLLFGVGAAKINYEQRLSALKALQDPDTKTKARMAAARAIADELKVYDDKHGTTYAKQWVGDSFSSIMRKKPVDIDSKIIKKYSQEPRKGEEPPEAEPPVQEAPPETPPPPPGSGEITGGPGTTPPPMGEDEPILPEDELDAEDAAKEHDEDDLDKIIETDDAADETDTEPTDAEIEAGNYKKGHVKLHGMDISIENPRGSTRKGADEDGKEWETTFTHHYGYIKGTVGRDKDHIDTFIGPNPASDRAFVVNQVNPKTGKFDEHKIMLGFDSIEEAQQGYLSNYEAGWTGLGSIHELDVEDLRTWTKDGDTKIEYDPQDYPEFHEETIDDEETVTGGAPGTPAPGGEIGITGGPRPQGETGGIGLPEDILKGLEEIFGEKPPAGEVQGEDEFKSTMDRMENDGWGFDGTNWLRKGDLAIRADTEEAEENRPPETMDDPVIFFFRNKNGDSDFKRYDTFREWVEEHLGEKKAQPEGGEGPGEITGGPRGDGGEKEAESEGEKPGGVTGGARAPVGEKESEGETKPSEGETPAPSGETKPEKPKKEESKQDKAVKAFDELSAKTTDETGKQAHAIVDHEDAGQYGRLVDEVRNILADMTKSAKTMKGSPKEVQRAVENALSILKESRSWLDQITDEIKDLGQKMAEAFNGLTVYNKAQWLAREAADAVGEGRFNDAVRHLGEIKSRLDKGNADYSKWAMSFKMNEDGTLKPYTSLQEKGKLKWGKTIGGSRADIAQPLGGTEKDIEDMSDEERQKKVTKDFVWPTPNYEIMVNEGAEPHVAYLVKEIRDAIPQKPDLRDGTQYAKFIRQVSEIRDILMAVKTEDDMNATAERIKALREESTKTPWDLYTGDHWWKIVSLLNRATSKMYKKEQRFVEENGWPGGGAWRRGIKIEQERSEEGHDVWAIRRRLGTGRYQYWSLMATGFETRELAEEYLVNTLKPLIEKELKDRRMDRPILSKVIRKGPDYRGGKDIEPEKFLKTFGFRKGWGEEGAGMETGKWNKSTLQMYINCAYDSFMDLARILNVDPKIMSLNGTLSIAFGARGRGGKAAAHYESSRKVINLTKFNGAGSLAHEWGHALDDYMGGSTGISGYLSTAAEDAYRAEVFAGDNETKRAMYELWHESMYKRYSTAEELESEVQRGIDANKGWVDSLVHDLERYKVDAAGIERFRAFADEIMSVKPDVASRRVGEIQTLFLQISKHDMSKKAAAIMVDNFRYSAVKMREAEDVRAGNGRIGSLRKTKWYQNCSQVDPKGTYWRTPVEMFARAFESFVEDTITGYATQSDYLVHGTHSATYARPVYPDGGERELINAKIEKLVKTLGFPEFKVEDKPVITTIWDNPQYDQEEEGGDQVPSDQETKGEEEGPEIIMEDYSDKSFVIRDRTGKHKARIEGAGGKFNPNLKGGAGYIFPMFRKESVTRELVDILFGGEKGKPTYPYQNMTLEDLHKPDKYGLIAKNMLHMLKSGWHIDKNATAIRAEVARMLNGDPKELVSGYGYTKIIDELMEYAVVMRAREIIQAADANDLSEADLYDQLKELYATQPILGARTSYSAERQAYSTPVHIAWIMQAAAGVRGGVSVYEPTAGTGMLLTKADESKAMVNEIDEMRLNILKDQGFANVMNKDGQKAVSLAGANRTFDVVMANPPFGKTDTKSIDGYLMSKKEHLIAVDALKAMKEDGVAAIIIGGHNYDGDKMSTPDRLFFNWLYSRYNVTANVEIPGKEYAKQGASFPFRILFINGVNKSGKGVAPSKKDIISLNSADELFALFRKGELYGARRLSAEGTEGVSKGPEVMGGSRQPGSKGGSTGVRPGVSGEAGDDDGQGKVRRGSSGGSSGGIGGGRGKPGGEDAGEPGGSEGVLGNDELSPEGSEPGGSEEGVGAGSGKGRGPQRGGAVRTGGQTDAEGIPGLSPIENELTSLTDDGIGDLLDDVFGKEATAGEIALKAGSEVAEGIHEAVKGLSTLFTPKETTLTMGIVFDEETYAKARPHFENAWESFKAAGKTLKDLLVYLKGKYGDKILPYVKRFLQDMQDAVSNLHQVPYKAMSKAPAVEETFIPRNMALPLRRALERIEEEVGDIDDFVTEKLEYKDNETLWKHLGPDQVDACAIAIYNMSMGKTAIIGDQTGVGKGRVAAAMIRYAHLQGKRAIFFTEKANLFTDIYRDIVDVGWGDKFKPFILASDPKLATIYDKNGAPAFKLMDDEKRRDLLRKFVGKDVQKNPAVLDPFNTIVTNYSQVNKANLQQEFLMEAVPGSVLILDEAHNASGIDSTTGLYMQEMIEHLGVEGDLMFLSATFAKRPNTMGIYINRTAQKAANMEPGEILDAIIRGKTPMQEYVCSALTRVGEYLRREKSFRGIEMRTYYDSKNRELHEEQANANTRNLREIVDFDKELKKWLDQVIHEAANGDIDDELEIGGVQWIPGGEIVNNKRSFSTTVTKANFASTVHNAVRQSLLCMKCDLAVEQAIKELKGDNENGRRQKPVIAVSSTLGSFLKEMHDEKLIQLGQEANMRLADVIRVYLKRCLKLTLKDDHGKKEVYFMDPKQLPKKLRDRYFAVEKAILDTTPDLPGSPIDYMLYKLRAAGVKVDEITGRGHCIEYDAKTGKGKFTYREDRRAAAIRDFNSGELDALVINAAGSVGL